MKRTYLAGLAFLFSGLIAGCPQPEACGNGNDDDKDGAIDCADDECTTDGACIERCADLIDNNRDGLTDCADPQCAAECDESSQCNDGRDNDQDGTEDCGDSDCAAFPACVPENCTNGVDDNANGDTDCDDIQCALDPSCPESNCINGIDDDQDGSIDCADSDCASQLICATGQCNDGLDNDGDVLVDAADPGCINGGATEVDNNQCTNGIDDDFDGDIDGQDAQCGATGHEANANALPDLIMLSDADRCSVFTDQNGNPTPGCQPQVREVSGVSVNDPEFQAGCFTGVGTRRIMEWNSIIVNQGDADLVVGDTSDHEPIWTVNPAFGDLQFEGWTRSFLRDTNNVVQAAGHKGSFCMIDLFDVGGTGKFFNCNNGQGISIDFGDVYSIGLACQFIDITGLPAGDYSLEVQVDFTNQLPESDYDNNSTTYGVVIP